VYLAWPHSNASGNWVRNWVTLKVVGVLSIKYCVQAVREVRMHSGIKINAEGRVEALLC